MSLVEFAVEELVTSGAEGKVLVGLLGLLLLVSLGALATSFGVKAASGSLFGVVGIVLGSVLGVSGGMVARARTEFVGLLLRRDTGLPSDLSETLRRLAELESTEFGCKLLGATVTLVSCLVLIVLAWRSGGGMLVRLASALASLLGAVTAAFVLVHLLHGNVPFHYCQGGGVPCFRSLLEELRDIAEVGAALVAVVGLAAICVVVFVALRRDWSAGPGFFAGGAITLALGGAALMTTRATARDAAAPLSAPLEGIECVSTKAPHSIPGALGNCESIDGPVVEVSRAGFVVDGLELPDALELESALRSKRKLFTELNPTRPFPGFVGLLASEDRPAVLLVPALRAAHRAGYQRVGVYSARPQPDERTSTLGMVERRDRCCATVFTLARGAEPVERFSTWGALHSAAARGNLSVAVK